MTSIATSDCPDADTWYGWLSGSLERAAARRCSKHVKRCAACSDFVARSRELVEIEQQLRTPDADDAEPNTQRWLTQVLAAVREHQNPPG